jgi:hypothetical protein
MDNEGAYSQIWPICPLGASHLIPSARTGFLKSISLLALIFPLNRVQFPRGPKRLPDKSTRPRHRVGERNERCPIQKTKNNVQYQFSMSKGSANTINVAKRRLSPSNASSIARPSSSGPDRRLRLSQASGRRRLRRT